MTKTIKLMAEYKCYPLWLLDPEVIGNINPTNLPLKQETMESLLAWALTYEGTINREYPPDSGFASEEDAQAFEREGLKLWYQLRKELAPEYKVFYFSVQSRKLLTKPSELEV
jgi:hypothetical protein